VIISIGLLGLLGLQNASLSNTEVSAAQSQATLAVESMADRMRVNMAGVRDGDYDDVTTKSASSAPNAPDCKNNSCDKKKIEELDLAEWQQTLGNTLPAAVGSVERIDNNKNKPDQPPFRFRITVSWRPHHAGYQKTVENPDAVADRCAKKSVHCLTRRVTL
jgi:type IV pilus modification protein PilV